MNVRVLYLERIREVWRIVTIFCVSVVGVFIVVVVVAALTGIPEDAAVVYVREVEGCWLGGCVGGCVTVAFVEFFSCVRPFLKSFFFSGQAPLTAVCDPPQLQHFISFVTAITFPSDFMKQPVKLDVTGFGTLIEVEKGENCGT